MPTRTMKSEAKRAGISLALAFAWCAMTFGGGWILGLIVEPGKPLFLFWAGMAYLWGLQKFMPSNAKGVGLDAAGGQSRTTAGLCADVGETR